MVNKSILNKLKDFGLNSYEARIWSALLLKGTATAGSLSSVADVPRSRCYDVLESLEKKGFIITKLGRPIKYLAVSPSEAVERVKQKLRDTAEEKVSVLENMKSTEVMEELNSLYANSMKEVSPEELTGVIKNKRNVYAHLGNLLRAAEKEVILATDAEGLRRKARLLRSMKKHNQNGPSLSILTEQDKENEALIQELQSFANVKLKEKVGRFVIVDGTTTFFLNDHQATDDESALWVSSANVTESLKELFNQTWAEI